MTQEGVKLLYNTLYNMLYNRFLLHNMIYNNFFLLYNMTQAQVKVT